MSDGSGETGALPFGGELHSFKLGQGQLFKIEAVTDESCFVVRNALQAQQGKLSWVRCVLVQGLIGGGKTPVEAEVMVKANVDDTGDWIVATMLATNILTVGLSGPVDDSDIDEDGEDGQTADPKD